MKAVTTSATLWQPQLSTTIMQGRSGKCSSLKGASCNSMCINMPAPSLQAMFCIVIMWRVTGSIR